MSLSYEALFSQRGSVYDRAMRRFPLARAQEFQQLVQAVPLQPGMLVADVPAGGGYLRQYLPQNCRWQGHEPCAAFQGGHGTRAASSLLPLPWADAAVDVVMSLAGIHHLDDKTPLFAEWLRVVKPRGRLVVSDVAAQSDVARFLDDFVGRHNSTGHQGAFLGRNTVDTLRALGWLVDHHAIVNFDWVFPDRQAMAAFCHELFDLQNVSLEQTEAAIESRLGVSTLANGDVGMRWSLMTIVATHP